MWLCTLMQVGQLHLANAAKLRVSTLSHRVACTPAVDIDKANIQNGNVEEVNVQWGERLSDPNAIPNKNGNSSTLQPSTAIHKITLRGGLYHE